MKAKGGFLKRQLPGVIAVVVAVVGYLVVSLPSVSAEEQNRMASTYSFKPMSIAMPPAEKQQKIREVNQDYERIRAWISSVGAAVAMNDLDGDKKANDLCIVDTRTDQVVVTPTPGAGDDRYSPIALDPGSLPMNDVMAPMGCVPADLNEDGRMDLLTYWWGRTPIIYLAKADAAELTEDAYTPVEMVPGDNKGQDGDYDGPEWNTNSATVGDFDADGHQDIFIGNYFPDGPVLDPSKSDGVTMNHSMSHASNSGKKMIFCWEDATGDSVKYMRAPDETFPTQALYGWTLASSATDLDGDLKPELYVANDFGPDRLLYNQSKKGAPKFVEVKTEHSPGVPKSKRIGNDSFKGMGVDFSDLNHDGVLDMFVSNITTPWGIQESNFQFESTVNSQEKLRNEFKQGKAPWTDRSAEDGTAWSGWGWDVKIADYNNSGSPVITQATGFVQGQTNRWPQLQELATANDALVSNPTSWPHVESGDDLGGDQTLHFFAKSSEGRYVDLAPQLGLAVPVPTRGIATGDPNGDGLVDFAVARQFDAPIFYQNEAPDAGEYLGLRLTQADTQTPGAMPAAGSPAIGAEVTVTTQDGKKFIDRVDGGSGHSGKRSHEVHIGLGKDVEGPVTVCVKWRDRNGDEHMKEFETSTGWHDYTLGTELEEG